MAIHYTLASMVKESLPEMIEAAKYCCNYKKTNGGCLGYPGAILLFSIIDSIGGYYSGKEDFKIKVDGKEKTIKSESWQHFYILNSYYFGQNLSEKSIKDLFKNVRSLLSHNSVIANNTSLKPHDSQDRAFYKDENGNYVVSLRELLALCEIAVEKFLEQADDIVHNSKQGNLILKK